MALAAGRQGACSGSLLATRRLQRVSAPTTHVWGSLPSIAVQQQRRCSVAASSSSNGDGPSTAGSDDGASVSSGGRFLRYNKDLPVTHHNPENVNHLDPNELPEHLRDLKLGDDGMLIDGKTGRVVNGLGATRFDVKVAALRGDLDPKPWEENTERAPGVLMQSLIQWPADYTFQVVGASKGGSPDGQHSDFVEDIVATVARITEVGLPLPEDAVKRRQRLNGKFVSLSITVKVRAPEIVMKTCEELQKDPRVKMSF